MTTTHPLDLILRAGQKSVRVQVQGWDGRQPTTSLREFLHGELDEAVKLLAQPRQDPDGE
jgi:hypothetical protein